MEVIPRKLVRLARLYGVQTSYLDMRRQKRQASVESLLAIVRILGADVRGMDDVDRALTAREQQVWDRVLTPVMVAWDGKIPPLRLRVPEMNRSILHHTIRLENGDNVHTAAVPLSKLLVKERKQIATTTYVARELLIRQTLPTGYHRIHI